MTAKACINWIEPESSTTVRVGDTVNCRLAMYNCGDVLGNFYATISKNGDRCSPDSCFNVWLEPACEDICECNFTMPDKVINLVFKGGHAEGGVWKEDFSKTITLTPHAYCEQRFRVVDEEGVNTDIATVKVYEGGSFWGHCTTVVGYCMVSDLEKGHTYKAVASKTGYDCLNCEKTFTACTSRITLSLKKKEAICNQPFRVEDTDGNIITKNCYIVVREGTAWRGECPTGSDGLCTVTGLIKGKYLKACIEQIPSGYEAISESCQNFTACTTTRTLKLKKIPSTGILRVTSTPVQGADIYINDIKQPYKTNHNFTLEAGYYNVKAMLEGYKEPAMQGVTVVAGETKTVSFTLVPVACDYTGHASNAKIDHDDVPGTAAEGDAVVATVSVDCIEIGETGYRVKFTQDSLSPVYSTPFLLGYIGEKDVSYSFTMPGHDVMLKAEVERCNASGMWEKCPHADATKIYSIKVSIGECEYTGHASNAKIDHDDVPGTAAEGDTVVATVSVDCIEIGETGYRVKFTQDSLSPVYSTPFLLGYIGEKDVSYSFTMPGHDVMLKAEVERCNASGDWELCPHADATKIYSIKVSIGECEYTGHASNAKIDHDDVPGTAAEGDTVVATVSVDCIEIGETRYRVKFTQDSLSPVYSTPFLLGYIGEKDVSYSFTMPGHDVMLKAEVERCNASGMWEKCPHADATKTYSIKREAPPTADINIITPYPTVDPSAVPPNSHFSLRGINIKNEGGDSDIPHIKLLRDTSLLKETDLTSLDSEEATTFEITDLPAPSTEGTYTLTLKVWGKNDQDESDASIWTGTLIVITTAYDAEITDYEAPPELEVGGNLVVPTTIKNKGIGGKFRMFLIDSDTSEEIDHKPVDTWQDLKSKLSITFAIFGDPLAYGAIPNNQIIEFVEFLRANTNVEITTEIKSYAEVPDPRYYPDEYDNPCYLLAPWNIPDSIKEELTGDIVFLLWNAGSKVVCLGGATWGHEAGINGSPVCSLHFEDAWFTGPFETFDYHGAFNMAFEFCNACGFIAEDLGVLFPSPEGCPSGLSLTDCLKWCLEYLPNVAVGESYSATIEGTMPDKNWNLKIEVKEESTPALDTKNFTVLKSIVTCDYTGHASNAKIDHDDVPGTAAEGDAVVATVSVDCIEVGETRYRVKFTRNGLPKYSTPFLLGYIGERDVSYSFTMPGHDVTLKAEVERCNASGMWEKCPHADATKIYSITLAIGKCDYTGHASNAKIDHDDVPGTAAEGDAVVATVSVDCIEVGETRYRVKFTRDGLPLVYSTPFLLGYIGEKDVSYSFTMPGHDVVLKAEVERCNASGDWEKCPHADATKTYSIKVSIGECEYTGHASDAKIDHDDVPEYEVEGENVEAIVSVDCIEIGETRYRVKFTHDSLSPEYSDSFLLGYYGEKDVSYNFPMLDHDVTLVVEIERCNNIGGWEPCEHEDHKKTYSIKLVQYIESHGKITEETVPPYSAQKGDEISIPTTIKNVGMEKGEFQMFLFDDVTNVLIEKEPCIGIPFTDTWVCTWKNLDPSEEYTNTLDTSWSPLLAMPNHDWKLRIEVRKQTTPDVADDTKKFTIKLGGPSGHIFVLDKIPTLVKGEKCVFCGNLTKEGVPVPAGEKIEIWEDDAFFNDKLGEGETDDEGVFSIEWTVTAVEGILGGANAEIYAYHPASETKSSIQKVRIKRPSELSVTTERYRINTIRPVDIELEYSDEGEWKPVKDYPKEVEDNPTEHKTFVYGKKHRVRAIRDYIITQLRSPWEEIDDPLEWDEKKVKLSMRRRLAIGEEEEE